MRPSISAVLFRYLNSLPILSASRPFKAPMLIAAALLSPLVANAEPAQAPQSVTYADPLLPNAAHPAGATLNKTDAAEGAEKWGANPEITIGQQGATASAPATAHLSIPWIAGKIRIEADIFSKGCGFTGLALGRGTMSPDLWHDLTLMLTVMPNGRYNVFAAKKNLIAAPNKTLMHAGASNHLELTLDTMARTYALRINGTTALEETPLPKEVQLDQITAAGFHFQEPVTAGEPAVSNFKVTLTNLAAAGLVPVDLSKFFVVPGEKTTLSWRVTAPGPSKQIPYLIKDYDGNLIESGSATQADDGTVSVNRTFPRGYAEIVFPEANQTFGIVSLEAHKGAPDPFFCIDAAITWLEQDQARREGLVEDMARSGIAMARERFSTVFTATPGVYNWESAREKGRPCGRCTRTIR